MSGYVTEPKSMCLMGSKANHRDIRCGESKLSITEAAIGGDGTASSSRLPRGGTEQVFYNPRG